ncbi:hypothetical protein AB0C47_34745 [Micromonospora taraxaci]|uniref:hypothetical protein n=1 Tax=Micromonospora taraxaci TaxID=1316803 RepID=UPI003402E16F
MPPRTQADPEAAKPTGEQPTTLDDDFWGARAHLKHIRDAAHSRQRSAPAVLGVTLARIAAMVDHRLRIPPIVGADAGLSLITAVLAPPGVGKSTASHIGTQLLPAPATLDIADQLPIGTGEGMVEIFFEMVDETDEETGKPKKVKKQVRHNAFFYVDEGQVLSEIGTRKNATLLPTIRSAFTGATLGQMNASEERRRILPAGSYTVGVVVALQTVLAGALLEDAEGGTPQRMLWFPAIDTTIPDNPPTWPGLLPWQPPTRDAVNALRDDGWLIGEDAHLTVAESIQREIRAADLRRARGEETTELLDAHEGLVKLKLAALLSILDGRLDINEEDWQLAACLKEASNETRNSVVEAVKQDGARREAEQSNRLARRAAQADVAVGERRVIDCSRKVAEKVWREPDRWTVAELRRSMSRWRDVLDEGVEHAVLEGWVVEKVESGQGASKRLLRRGEKRPS